MKPVATRWVALFAGGAALLVVGVVIGGTWERLTGASQHDALSLVPSADGAARAGGTRDGNARRAVQLNKVLEGLRGELADPGARLTRLRPGQPRRMTMNFREDPSHQFVIDVPENAVVLQVTVTGAPCLFDIYGRAAVPMEDPASEAEHYNEVLENKLFVSRYFDYPLESGEYYVVVEYASVYPPSLGNRTLATATYDIAVSFVQTRVDSELQDGKPQSGKLDPETGSFRTFVIDVPEEAPALRIDLDDTHSNLDVLVRHEAQIVHPEDADHTSAGYVGREIVVIDANSDPPLAPGRWYINVVESWGIDEADFTIYASLNDRPPAPLLAIPDPPPTPDGKARALYAAVDLTTGAGSGSGVVISPDGLILTNYHVVAEAVIAAEARRQEQAKRPSPTSAAAQPALDDVIVAVTLDVRHPPVEMFRGEVIEYDEKQDLALVRVTRGYYGQPTPAAYRFPCVEFGDAAGVAIGDPLLVVGFPGVGDLRNRPAVTLTQGIVSGFSDATKIKTDAHISGGNSGGGAFDRQWRLLGCPTFVMVGYSGDYGQLGYVVSLLALPDAWRRHLPATPAHQ